VQKETEMTIPTLPATPDTVEVRLVEALEGFQHTVSLHAYDEKSRPEIVVQFGGQGSVGDLRTAKEARELALALLAAANDLEVLRGALELPSLEQQYDDDKATWMEAKWAGRVGDFYWLTPTSPDIAGPGVAIDAYRHDRTPDAVRQLIVELSINLTAIEHLTKAGE
jgi:hypothetical protein